MQNLVMKYFRESTKMPLMVIAERLEISISTYNEIERGAILLDDKLAVKFGKLYNTKPIYFLESSRQLDYLLVSKEYTRILKATNSELKEKLSDIKLLMVSKNKPKKNRKKTGSLSQR